MGYGSDTADVFAALIQAPPGSHWDAEVCDPPADESTPDLSQYDRILVFTSGGKDCTACLLHLLDLGVPKERLELHHHMVDGNEGSRLMDWPVTTDYVSKFGAAFGLPVLFSWRQGGLEREMLRSNCGTAPITFTRGDGQMVTMGGERSKCSTRMKFPQVTADLRTRWCSGSAKIDVAARMLNNDERFRGKKTLVITGERAEESPGRAKYARFEPHRCDLRNGRVPRWIDHWRPVHRWTEQQVWACLRKYRIHAHPSYFLGWGRASCMSCIFSSKDAWSTIRLISPEHFKRIRDFEHQFGFTIHRTKSVEELADEGQPYPHAMDWKSLALSDTFNRSIFMDPWLLPSGAFGENCGPT